jgi:hypothetical protein
LSYGSENRVVKVTIIDGQTTRAGIVNVDQVLYMEEEVNE